MRRSRQASALTLLLAGCDIGDPDSRAEGPDLHVIATYPANGAGTECGADAPDDCGVPLDAAIELRFDRFLLPSTVSVGSIALYSSDAGIYLTPFYDLVERVVTFRLPFSRLLPGVLYQVRLYEPRKEKGRGLRALDGAPLVQEGSVPLLFSFRTARTPPAPPPPDPAPTCAEALALFERGGCTGCHAEGREAPMGLRLDTGAALRTTAVGRPSQEVEGPDVARVLVDPSHFGFGMARIEPGIPSRSYLMYKTLLRPENYGGACETTHRVELPEGSCLAPSEAERRRMADWFVRLDPMPPSGAFPGGVTDLRLLADFIRSGADTSECDAAPDGGGAGDAGDPSPAE